MAERELKKNESTIGAHSPAETSIERYEGEGIALWPIVMRFWQYRRTIGLALACALGLFLAGLLFVYIWYPNQKTVQMGFRLLFDGAERGEYPNGMPFSPTDITSDLVAGEVYETNALNQYGKFDNFKQSLFVKQNNVRLESLEAEYRGKLADTKLTPVDRQRLERDFAAQVKNLSSPEFNLVFVRTERFRTMPKTLAQKILTDILNFYARVADKEKGALKFRIPVPTRNMVRKDIIEEEDYIISLDMIRAAIQRVQTALAALKPIPGADVIRIGPTQLGLVDIQANLDDLVRFRLSPMIGAVRATAVTKNSALTLQYLQNQLFTLDLDREEADKRVKVYDENLRKYMQQRSGIAADSAGAGAQPSGTGGLGNVPALIPQLGDSFFDRLIELGQKGEDTIYRQEMVNKSIESGINIVTVDKELAYYKDLISIFQNPAKMVNPVAQKDFLSAFQTKYPKIIEELLQTIDNVNLFYDTLSQRNLNPTGQLIKITSQPSVNTVSAVAGKRILLAAFLYFLVVGMGILIVIFIRDKSRTASAKA